MQCLTCGQKGRTSPAMLPRPVHTTSFTLLELGHFPKHAFSYDVIIFKWCSCWVWPPYPTWENLHLLKCKQPRARLCWCHKALFIFPFSSQSAGSVLTSLLLLSLMIMLSFGDTLAHTRPPFYLALPLPLDFFLGSNLNVTPQADLYKAQSWFSLLCAPILFYFLPLYKITHQHLYHF